MPGIANVQIEFPIIDSHIHLYAEVHIKDLAFTDALPSGHVLKKQNSVAEYRAATHLQPSLLGFVFVETDRKSNLSEDGWKHPLEEIDFLRRIKAGSPRAEEGHVPEDKFLALGIVPWAPLPANLSLLNSYLGEASCFQISSVEEGLIKGFRYLVQDKPLGTQLDPNFVPNLLALEKKGFQTFDLAIDFHRRGTEHLQESIQMLTTFYASSTRDLNIIINHLAKPDLSSSPPESSTNFESWAACIHQFAAFPTTYMKLSGLFSEMPAQDPENPRYTTELLEYVRPWTRTIFEYFGPDRIMFGSDWPVCNVGGPGTEKSWQCWVELVAAVLDDVQCSRTEKAMVWAGTAKKAYSLNVHLAEVR